MLVHPHSYLVSGSPLGTEVRVTLRVTLRAVAWSTPIKKSSSYATVYYVHVHVCMYTVDHYMKSVGYVHACTCVYAHCKPLTMKEVYIHIGAHYGSIQYNMQSLTSGRVWCSIYQRGRHCPIFTFNLNHCRGMRDERCVWWEGVHASEKL